MTRNRKGFTLLEMLIAIAVLVILSGVTLFSTLDLVTIADANKVINDMVQLKTATFMWYKENSSRVVLNSEGTYQIKTNGTVQAFKFFIRDYGKNEILKYMDRKDTIVLRNKEDDTNETGDFTLIDTDNGKKWYVCYNLGAPNLTTKGEEAPDAKVREKIAGKAKQFNLLGLDNIKNTPQKKYTASNRFACMLILELKK